MNKSCKYLLALAALASPAFLSAQEVIHRYSFGGNASDGVGSLNGTLSAAGTNLEAPLFNSNTPTGANTAFASGSIQLGMTADTASFVNFGTPALYDGKAGSVSLWFNPASTFTGQREIFSNLSTAAQLRTFISSDGSITVGGAPINNVTSDSGFFTGGEWNHMVLTWDDAAGAGSVNINGVSLAYTQTSAGVLNDPLRLMLGNFANNTTDIGTQFVGEFYDLQIYDGVLSSGDISFLNSNPGVAIPEPSTYGVLLGMLVLGVVVMRRRIAA